MLFIPPEGPRCSGGSYVVVRHIIRHVNGQCGGLEGVGSHDGEQASSLICGALSRGRSHPARPPGSRGRARAACSVGSPGVSTDMTWLSL